ncbi:DnaJ domain-containing protein [Sulfurimonas sp.]|uniref:J domain-containing protein n=1 Tax=Sulfurimonas sp. TaxID=2022749 RepID=UPI002620FF3C|nr:DnaJ domain-containing protein [Sulfurimonas sp.]
MDLENLLSMGFIFAIAFYFSKKAQTLFFHLLYSYLGIYLIVHAGFDNPLYDQKLIVGIALLAPQLKFLVQFTQDTIQNIKMMSANTYYFFITLYYKIIRFINWVRAIPIIISSFFESFGAKSEEETSKKKSYKQEQSYQEQSYRSSYSQQEKQHTQESPKEPQNEFAQFYSDSAYTVLGVSSDDDFKTIKKAYRKLVREYHPDLNPENIELYTEITQNINNAWEKIEQWKK